MSELMRSLYNDNRGSFAIIAAVASGVLIGAVGIGFDVAILTQQKNKLQQTADAAALASALEMGLASTDEGDVRQVALQYVDLNFTKEAVINSNKERMVKVDVNVRPDKTQVTVDLSYIWAPFLAHLVSDTITPITVSATAELAGNQSICVIALDEIQDGSLSMSGGNSSIMANKCGIYANSSANNGIIVTKGAVLESASTYVAGGYTGEQDSFVPEPITDSPVIGDPLLQRPSPSVGKCKTMKENPRALNSKSTIASSQNSTPNLITTSQNLTPGTFCGGLSITSSATVKLAPGIYVIKDGPLFVSGNASLIGENVGFFFIGDESTFDFGVSTQIDITAPTDGEMAGILFFEDRDAPAKRVFTIRSKDAERFEGTVYLPKGKLFIDKESRVGQRSNWTAIVVNQLEIGDGPKLEINANFANSDIPVPDVIAAGISTSSNPLLVSSNR